MNNTYLENAIHAALKAGQAINKIYEDSQDIEIITKADDSPLTIADKIGHKIIVEHLEKLNLPILSEEGEQIDWEIRKKWSLFWLIDPLDGTKEFINRNGEFTVNIALIKDGQPVLGVVYLPVTKELYFGDIEFGAYKRVLEQSEVVNNIMDNTFKLPCARTDVFTIIVSKSHMSPETEEVVEACKKHYGEIKTISCGSSKKLCLLAEEKVNLYPRLAPTMEWDIAAAHAIVKASGKKIIRFNSNEEIVYNKENLLNPFFIAYDSKYYLND